MFIAHSVDGYIATDDDNLDWLMSAGAEGEDYGFEAYTSAPERRYFFLAAAMPRPAPMPRPAAAARAAGT